MTISIWRYSHFLLAAIASLFLLLASVTGVILAVEPIQHQFQGYAIDNLETISTGDAITLLQNSHEEVFSLTVEPSGFVKASVLTTDLETAEVYVDPRTGATLAPVPERPDLYRFTTNLHRSLFLKTTGRVFVGVVSFLLCLIAITGFVLLLKRQGGVKRLFSKVQKDYFELRYHVVLSRWMFLPILIVAVTGVYLSIEKFGWLPQTNALQTTSEEVEITSVYAKPADLPILQEITLDQVRTIEFPFSDHPEEYYQLSLVDREIRVNQQSGALLSEATYPFVDLASRWSFQLHTGEGSVWWSVVLLLASASIVFFMYSGFVMSWRRLRSKKTPWVTRPASEADMIVMVGSETGSTYNIATRFCIAAEKAGYALHRCELNAYAEVFEQTDGFKNIKQILILTATYGKGEAPTNARKFEALVRSLPPKHTVAYAVVGFGSLEYPDYCQFAIRVDELLASIDTFERAHPLYKINNANTAEFDHWVAKWQQPLPHSFVIAHPKGKKKQIKQHSFTVMERTPLNVDDTFLLRLRPKETIRFVSGDLLTVLPKGSEIVRQYSIAKINGDILLSIKKHEFGRASSQLFELEPGEQLTASLEINKQFHFPKHCKEAIFIANGTGIAPFFGMIAANPNTKIHLFWGSRTEASLALYQPILAEVLAKNPHYTLHSCSSREGSNRYVQDLLHTETALVQQVCSNDGVVMICGSLAMQHDVLDVLDAQLEQHPDLSLDVLEHQQQLKMDCY